MRKVGKIDSRGKPRVQTKDFGPSKAIQSEKPDHVREILKRYGHVGVVEALKETDLRFADLSTLGSFADVQRTVKAAEMEFMEMPSKVREVFGHKVENWLDASERGLTQEQTNALVRGGYMEAPEAPTPPVDLGGGDGSPTGEVAGGDSI